MLTIACVASWTSRSRAERAREVGRDASRGSRVRLGVAAEPAEDGLDGAGARAERVVVELLGELERRAGVVERPT